MKKKTPARQEKIITKESLFNTRDKVNINYRTKWFDIINVPGIILRANRGSGYPFKVQLQDNSGKLINLGHDDDGGSPGSGPFMYCREEHMKLIEKFIPKRLKGEIKTNWKVGDYFTPKKDFSIEQHEDDDRTGVTKEQVKNCVNKRLTIISIIKECDTIWLLDNSENYMWLPEWIDAVE